MKNPHSFLCLAIITLLLSALSPLEAKQKEKATHPIAGAWQRVQLRANNDDGKVFIVCDPFFKFLNEDGTFFNMTYPVAGKAAYFTQAGDYEILSDSTYVEKITSAPSALFRGKDSQIKYQFSNDKKQMIIKWYNENLHQWTPELWIRVEVPSTNAPIPNKNE